MTRAIVARLSKLKLDHARSERIADYLAVATAASLPWSTSAAGILIAAWLVSFLLTYPSTAIRQELATAAGGLPALLWLFAVLGMLWADAGLAQRLSALGGFHKLLLIPLLLAQFRRSERGAWVLYGFLASCSALMLASWIQHVLWLLAPVHETTGRVPGVPVRDYIAQSAELSVCAFALLALSIDRVRSRAWPIRLGSAALALLFLANVFYVATGRTSLVVFPVLFAALGFWWSGWRGLVGASVAACAVCAALWLSSPLVQERVIRALEDTREFRAAGDQSSITSAAVRLELWKKSIAFIADAPVFGHGTGSIPGLYRRAAAAQSGIAAIASDNPHNQYLGVAIQLGLVGTVLLLAMWLAHLSLFGGGSLVAWIGTVVVLQNMVSSLFNSHLFDFFHGWLYVIGVGVAGGMALREKSSAAATSTPAADPRRADASQ